MTQQQNRLADSQLSDWGEAGARFGGLANVPPHSAPCSPAMEDAGYSVARLLNGPLTALLIYMEELKQRSHQLCDKPDERDHLQKVIESALLQTQRVCALVKQIGGTEPGAIAPAARQGRLEQAGARAAPALLSSDISRKRLTRREHEVLNLISQGFSNKQGALRMHISPRTFESHRAEAMRKLGARNTADLVRAALLHPID